MLLSLGSSVGFSRSNSRSRPTSPADRLASPPSGGAGRSTSESAYSPCEHPAKAARSQSDAPTSSSSADPQEPQQDERLAKLQMPPPSSPYV